MPEKVTLGCQCMVCSQIFVSTESPTMPIAYEDPAKFWAIVLAASTWCEWIKLEVPLPPLAHLRNKICAPLSVLNEYPWSKRLKHYMHSVPDKHDEDDLDVPATWACYQQSAQAKIGTMEGSKRQALLGELFSALCRQQAAIQDGVAAEEWMEREPYQLQDYVAKKRYTVNGTDRSQYWWVYSHVDKADDTWDIDLALATTDVLAPAVITWKNQSLSRRGLCADCTQARRA
ncbi:hypothetical protein F5Y08DRAFT_346334 [Xylaria arbuscula]|nr:hypothetical protein F5Y08DRAFT_346334 [Xylaria arbuscula]